MMQWSSDDVYDVSSTTSPPVHPKPLPFPQPSRPGFSGYTDDISALSASSLLKRYAERYSFSSALPEHGSFLRSEQHQEAWPVGYVAEGPPGLDALKGSRSDLTVQQYNGGPTSQDFSSSYSSQHLLPKPSYLPSPAFALPSAYLPPTPGYAYPQQCGLTAGYPHSTPPLLPSGLHTPTPLNALHVHAEPPRNRKFGFDQPKTARVSPYTIRDKSDRQSGDGGNVNESCGTDVQSYRPDRLSSHTDIEVDSVGKTGNVQPLEARSYGGSGQYTYP
ncbi:fidgetin-like protein 2 [Triplophysa rosa]|uniref:Fidgetin-like protein 2 n=1 Tax=Triplophysa rosa TaxID=992332 RepID=A0A9W8C536_TRIRA|nr:fidgetin-like protein 2 [Triplophysa rosa]XP_057194141.1 fidgetin-like protein 2 [Triplophysa rosa]KAI7807358.1 putative fidgetin-like protein 2 [Triplophysa rosa]